MSAKAFKMLLLTAMIFVLISFVFMQLWNYAIPHVFKLPEINFAESSSILIMNRILFAGWGTHFKKYASRDKVQEKDLEGWKQEIKDHFSPASDGQVSEFRSRWAGMCTRQTTNGLSATEQKKQENQTKDVV